MAIAALTCQPGGQLRPLSRRAAGSERDDDIEQGF